MNRDALTCPKCGSKDVSPHFTPVPAEGEADLWVPVREEAYWCHSCGLTEECLNTAGDAYDVFRARWNDPIEYLTPAQHQAFIDEMNRIDEERAREWTWPDEDEEGIRDRAWRDARLREHREHDLFDHTTIENNELHFQEVKALPRNESLLARILADPDDPAPRAQLVAWLRTQDHPMAPQAADFIEAQLRLARSFVDDPRADIKDSLPEHAFSPRVQSKRHVPDQDWWRFARRGELMRAMFDDPIVLREVGVIDDERYFRGFVEHVAIKATRFLELADELYERAPIRQLTLTYCKGRNHDDPGVLKALLDSPHLDRIRALKLPVRKFGWDKGDVTELNRLTDDDLAQLASSPHLRGLRHLDLEDQHHLTIRAFDALAASPNLPELSAVRYDLHRYWYPGAFSFGTVGDQQRLLIDRPLERFAPELEARHGYRPWLHVADHYGTAAPDVEAVIEHPVALRHR